MTIYTDRLPENTTSWVSGGQINAAGHYREASVTEGWRAQYRAAMATSWRRFSALDPRTYDIEWFTTYHQSKSDLPGWMLPSSMIPSFSKSTV